jgi:Domain of unknown function (DUF4386)
MNAPKRLARIAGVLYVLVAILSGFAYLTDKKVYVSGDAAATARNVVAHSGLVRAAVVADLFQATIWVFLAMTLYLLLKHVNKNAASAMVVLVAIGPVSRSSTRSSSLRACGPQPGSRRGARPVIATPPHGGETADQGQFSPDQLRYPVASTERTPETSS